MSKGQIVTGDGSLGGWIVWVKLLHGRFAGEQIIKATKGLPMPSGKFARGYQIHLETFAEGVFRHLLEHTQEEFHIEIKGLPFTVQKI
jgi:hypothetical protein